MCSRTASSTSSLPGRAARGRPRSRAARCLAGPQSMPSSTMRRAAAAAISAVMAVMGSGQLGAVHAAGNHAGPGHHIGRGRLALEALGRRQHDGQPRGLEGPEPGRIGVEVVARRGLGAEQAFAPLDAVQIDLQDAALVQQPLEHQRDDKLLALAQQRALAGQEQVLGQLLADGGAADHLGHALAPRLDPGLGLLVLLPGALEGVPVDAAVLGEAIVLAGDHGALERAGELGVIHPLLAPGHLMLVDRQAQDLAALEAGRLRRDPAHQQDAPGKPELQAQQGQCQHGEQAAGLADHDAASNSALSAASTGAVSGLTPRQKKKASAACSTSMPRPSRGSAPWAAAQSR
mmetsp:Transcript_6765/g.28422  ORF Transcript_6765/g.28422 Transcript_6765/m.28422 type:complete len:347 (-) Transcript_6765:4243-5283(-)